MVQMRDDKTCLPEQPENLAKKRNSIDKCSWKKNIHSGTEYATFFRSIKLCADDKLFWTTEETNSKAQNQKTTFDRLEHSAISDRLRF